MPQAHYHVAPSDPVAIELHKMGVETGLLAPWQYQAQQLAARKAEMAPPDLCTQDARCGFQVAPSDLVVSELQKTRLEKGLRHHVSSAASCGTNDGDGTA